GQRPGRSPSSFPGTPLTAPPRSAPSSNVSAAGSSIPSTPPRSSASARARLAPRTSVKISIVATNHCAPAGQFVLHAQSLPGNPLRRPYAARRYRGRPASHRPPHRAAYVDKGYRGLGGSDPRRVFISGQKRGVFGVIKRELRRRSAIEPLIGH